MIGQNDVNFISAYADQNHVPSLAAARLEFEKIYEILCKKHKKR